MMETGNKALILRDLRERNDVSPGATGKLAVNEGRYPRKVLLKVQPASGSPLIDEFELESFLDGPLSKKYPQWEAGKPEPEGLGSWKIVDERRFLLPDGTRIWADECWWEPQNATPERDQERVREFSDFLEAVYNLEGE